MMEYLMKLIKMSEKISNLRREIEKPKQGLYYAHQTRIKIQALFENTMKPLKQALHDAENMMYFVDM